MSRKIRRNQGFSLLELVVVGGIGATIMLGVAQILSTFQRAKNGIDQSAEFGDLKTLLTLTLANPAKCPAALQTAAGAPIAGPSSVTAATPNLPAGGITVGKIVDSGLSVVAGARFGNLTIDSIGIFQVVPGTPQNAATVPYVANLRVMGTKRSNPGGMPLKANIPLSITFETPVGGGAPVVLSCSTQAVSGSPGGGGGTIRTCSGTVTGVGSPVGVSLASCGFTAPPRVIMSLATSSTGLPGGGGFYQLLGYSIQPTSITTTSFSANCHALTEFSGSPPTSTKSATCSWVAIGN